MTTSTSFTYEALLGLIPTIIIDSKPIFICSAYNGTDNTCETELDSIYFNSLRELYCNIKSLGVNALNDDLAMISDCFPLSNGSHCIGYLNTNESVVSQLNEGFYDAYRDEINLQCVNNGLTLEQFKSKLFYSVACSYNKFDGDDRNHIEISEILSADIESQLMLMGAKSSY